MTKIVQSIVHLREFSFLPISTLGRRASVAGCSLLNLPRNKDAQGQRGKVVTSLDEADADRSEFFSVARIVGAGRNLSGHERTIWANYLGMRGSPTYGRGIVV